jgi:hypothetical protein
MKIEIEAKANPGRIITLYTVWCAQCSEQTTLHAMTIDKFIEEIDQKWRLTTELGWVHKKCAKMMPTQLKF